MKIILSILVTLFIVSELQARPIRYRRSMIASILAIESVKKSSPIPTPPAPTDMCLNCRGTGKIGDGTISVTCPACNGTGKKKVVPKAPADPCPDGNCQPPKQEQVEIMQARPIRRFGGFRRQFIFRRGGGCNG